MRLILVAIILCITTPAWTEEAYQLTGKAFGACVGTQMRYKYEPPEMIRKVVKNKCGKLEEQEREQFADFIKSHIGETFTPELAATIMFHSFASLQVLREGAIDAYLNAVAKPSNNSSHPTPKSATPPLNITH